MAMSEQKLNEILNTIIANYGMKGCILTNALCDILEKYDCGISTEECSGEKIAKAIQEMKNLTHTEYDGMCKNAEYAATQFDIANLSIQYIELLQDAKEKYGKGREKTK